MTESMRTRRHTITVASALVLIGLTVVVTRVTTQFFWQSEKPLSAERAWLLERYGPNRHSRGYEEWIIRDFFRDRRDGVFVDIGAGDPRIHSNTNHLERTLNWSGLAVDAQESFAPSYRLQRPRSIFEAALVGSTNDDDIVLHTTERNWEVASVEQRFTERFGQVGTRTVRTVRLSDLLDRHGFTKIDLLSIDVELSEPAVLAGFDLHRFRPALVCIEAHPEVRQQILDYFAEGGYRLLGKYLRVDEDNLYFVPAGITMVPFPRAVESGWSIGHR